MRIIKDETGYVNAFPSDVYSNAHDWTTRRTYEQTLTKSMIVFIKWVFNVTSAHVNTRVLINGVPFLSSGYKGNGTGYVRWGYVYLAAGTYTFDLQTSNWYSSGSVQITQIYIAGCNFTDTLADAFDKSLSVANNATETVIEETFTIPASAGRKMAVGVIQRFQAYFAFNLSADVRANQLKSGDSDPDESGALNWRLYRDDVEIGWSDANEDDYSRASNPTYGEGSTAKSRHPMYIGDSTTYKITCKNLTGSSQNARATINVLASPWLITFAGYFEPVLLDFPQGSTIYVTLEPMHANENKYIRLGHPRFVSFGDATDFYASAEGTGILTLDYTFEIVEVSNCQLKVLALTGSEPFGPVACVSTLAVDIR
jgi:hypothetical protein